MMSLSLLPARGSEQEKVIGLSVHICISRYQGFIQDLEFGEELSKNVLT